MFFGVKVICFVFKCIYPTTLTSELYLKIKLLFIFLAIPFAKFVYIADIMNPFQIKSMNIFKITEITDRERQKRQKVQKGQKGQRVREREIERERDTHTHIYR